MMDNASYPVSVVWNLTPVRSNISHISLYVSVFFDLHFSFLQAYVPGVLNWENPWARPSSSQGSDWAVVNFSSSILTGNQLVFNDSEEMVTYALEFGELPNWGNVGALANMQIDALRFQYDFDAIDVNQSVSFSYRTLAFSKSSLLEVQESNDVGALFALTPHVAFVVETRDYHEYIKNENIRFIVYDRNKLDTKIIRSNMLELVYCNDRYVIFKIKDVAWQG